jgi:hypothetical protein
MAIRKLVLDDFLETEVYTLIGIHCTIEDYRLAYLLNKALEINLSRKPKDLDNCNLKTAYPIYEWENPTQLATWNLVANSCKVKNDPDTNTLNSLFNAQQGSTKVYHLVPEYKKVNYLLKIENELSSNREKLILNNILNIPQVVTAYSIDAEQLKSKDNLIFY